MSSVVTFRFYEELNLFLKKELRKKPFEWEINGKANIKDVIEALGVPHTEVDVILVNSKPVDFSYSLQPNDFISVYPVFESFDVSHLSVLRDKPLRNPHFILDVHLGKLVKYLRLAGFDCLYETNYTDPQIIEISVAERRIILTRDKGILKNKKVTHGCYIHSNKPKEQFLEIINRLQLENQIRPFTRCTICNGEIVQVDKSKVADQLQPLTLKYFTEFYQCLGCGRVYWEGSHFERMNGFISRWVEGSR